MGWHAVKPNQQKTPTKTNLLQSTREREIIGAFGIVTKGLVLGLDDLEIRGRVETIQTTALLRSARILRRVLEICGYLLSLKVQLKATS